MKRKHHELLWGMVALLHAKGVQQAVLCPGSRNGPLIHGFSSHPGITSHSFVDERSAAYCALGMAEELSQPVVLVCTSGTAALNFAPAVAEAFYQNIPLIVLTADRPAEWIDQLDGQAIRQAGLYGSHVKMSCSLPEENPDPDSAWHSARMVNEAANAALHVPRGPVHINVPLREPLYLPAGERPDFRTMPKIIAATTGLPVLSQDQQDELLSELGMYRRIMVLGGQGPRNNSLVDALSVLSTKYFALVVGDCVSNLGAVAGALSIPDHAAAALNDSHAPDLLMTFGRSILSRKLKTFLRKNRPTAHWHVGMGPAADVFQALTRHIETSPDRFFRLLTEKLSGPMGDVGYAKTVRTAVTAARESFLGRSSGGGAFTEFAAVDRLMQCIPDGEVLHLGNSMPVRWADYAGIPAGNIEVFCNRGTSGIDGSVSTAVGHAVAAPHKRHTLLLGDLALFYDINGFWHDKLPPNVRVVVLNNHGGKIFEVIEGPADNPSALSFFTTPHSRPAGPVAAMFGMEYLKAATCSEMEEAFGKLWKPSERAVMLELDFK